MLIGRVVEQSRIAALLDEALAGRSGALVIRGEAGIGKSALLFEAASTDQFQVLRARGLETESEIPFSGLHDLLAPILDARSQLPNPQAEAIGSALSVGPPVPVERLAICAGVLGLLSAASRQHPVLVVIDDAHLLDHPSSDAIGFAARRLRDDRIAMLLTVRDGEGSTIATDGIADMVLEPLDDGSAAALLERRGQPAVGKARQTSWPWRAATRWRSSSCRSTPTLTPVRRRPERFLRGASCLEPSVGASRRCRRPRGSPWRWLPPATTTTFGRF